MIYGWFIRGRSNERWQYTEFYSSMFGASLFGSNGINPHYSQIVT